MLIKDETKFNLNFTVKDDRILDYVLIEIPGVEGFESRRIEAGGQSTLSFTEKIILPNEVKSYDVTLTAVDARGNQTVTNSTISVSEMPDFPKMYLADVATVEELNSDIFGVPMVINHRASTNIVHVIIIKLPVRKFSSYRKRQTLLLSVLALIRRIIQN